MIFTPKLARAIIRGKKTQTRRPVKWLASDDLEQTPVQRKRNPSRYVDADYPNKVGASCRYRVDHDYSLQRARGKEAEPGIRLQVTAVRREMLGDLRYVDAVAEGFKTRDEFFAYWEELYGEPPDLELQVWVITFQPTFADEYLTDNRDPRKGPLDIVPMPPSTGGMRGEPQLIPTAHRKLLTQEAHNREADELGTYLEALDNAEEALSGRLKQRPEINGEVQRAKKQIGQAKAKLKSQIAGLERAA